MTSGLYTFSHWVFYGVNTMLLNEHRDNKKHFFSLTSSLIIDITPNTKTNIRSDITMTFCLDLIHTCI